jgi:hypothetical protein
VETTYAKDGTHYQKAIGVVNWTKFNSTSRIPSLCISGGENQTWVRLTFVDSNIIDTVWSCTTVTTCSKTCEGARQLCYKACNSDRLTDNSICIAVCDTAANVCLDVCPPDCKEPNDEQLVKEWRTQNMTRKMLVFIQNGTSLDLGKLEVRLKG